MNTLWFSGGGTVNELAQRLEGSKSWHPKTVRTMLNRLVKKGYVKCARTEGVYFYSSSRGREQCVGQASVQFIDRVFDGALAPMVAHVVRTRGISDSEREALRRILDEELSDE
jgi:BlaI family penicillinase repressor